VFGMFKHGSHVTGIPKADWPGVKNKQQQPRPVLGPGRRPKTGVNKSNKINLAKNWQSFECVRQMPPASGLVLNETAAPVDAGDASVPAVVGRGRVRGGGTVPGLQRDDQGLSDSEDSEMDRLYSTQLGQNSNRCALYIAM